MTGGSCPLFQSLRVNKFEAGGQYVLHNGFVQSVL